MNNQIKNGALISYIFIFINIISGIIYTPWMITTIGKEDYSLYILSTTFLSYFVVDYGIWQSINKIISQYRAEGKIKEIDTVIGVATKIYLFIDFIILIVLFNIYFNIDHIFSNLEIYQIKKLKIIIIILSIFSVLNFPFTFLKGVMYSYELIVANKLFDFFSKITIISFTAIALIFGFGLYILVFIYAFVPLLKSVYMIYYLYKKGIKFGFSKWDNIIAKKILSLSGWLFVFVLAEISINNISPYLITIYDSVQNVAIFAIGFSLFGYTYQICNSINGFFLPKISKMLLNNDEVVIEKYSLKVSKIQLIICCYIIFGILVCGKQFIIAWVGPAFIDSYYIAVFLTLPGIIVYSQQIEQTILFAKDKLKFRAVLYICTAFLTLILSILLIPNVGTIGAALAISISNILFMVIIMNYYYKSKLNIDIKSYFKLLWNILYKYSILLLILSLAKYLYKIDYYFNSWTQFVIIGILYSLLYIIFTYFFVLNNGERYSISINLKKKL